MKDFPHNHNLTGDKILDTLINNIADSLGEEVIEYISSGAMGFTFKLKSGRVLKITKDQNEINLIYNLSKLSSIPKSLMTYYNIGKIGKIDKYINNSQTSEETRSPKNIWKYLRANKNTDLLSSDVEYYYILMDYIEILSDLEQDVIDQFFRHRIQYNLDYYENIMNEFLEQHVIDWFNRGFRAKEKTQIALELLPHVRNIVKDLKKYKIKSTDFHSQNLGWNKNHKLILFDLGGYISSTDKPKDKTPKLKTMQLEKFNPTTQREIWIEQIATDLGEKIKHYKNSGSFGWVYETKSGKILKLTSDPAEIRIAYKLTKNKNWFQYIINYYNVGKTNKFYDDRSLYYILMDKVYPIDGEEAEVINLVYQDLIQYDTNYYENIMNKKMVDNAIRGCYSFEEKKLARSLHKHIVNIVKELKSHKIKETDFHAGNIGWDKDRTKLILYDLGGHVNMDELDKIKIKNKIPLLKLKKKRQKSLKFNQWLLKTENWNNIPEDDLGEQNFLYSVENIYNYLINKGIDQIILSKNKKTIYSNENRFQIYVWARDTEVILRYVDPIEDSSYQQIFSKENNNWLEDIYELIKDIDFKYTTKRYNL